MNLKERLENIRRLKMKMRLRELGFKQDISDLSTFILEELLRKLEGFHGGIENEILFRN